MVNTRTPCDPSITLIHDRNQDQDRDPLGTLPQHIIHSLNERHQLDILAADTCPSAQHRVWILKVQRRRDGEDRGGNDDPHAPSSHEEGDSVLWRDGLVQGQNRIVVREWRGGSQWWNLHRNHSIKALAQAELRAYRWAREMMTMRVTTMDDHDHDHWSSDHEIVIPRILYSEIDPVSIPIQPQSPPQHHGAEWYPWAILEYVGPDSLYFCGKSIDRTWVEGMVPVRREFGFDEPHPRWGRVPEEKALDYAMMILDQVILPLHTAGWKDEIEQRNAKKNDNDWKDEEVAPCSITYDSMVCLYQQAYQDLLRHLEGQNYGGQSTDAMDSDMAVHPWTQVLELVHNAIENVLPSFLTTKSIPAIPHMNALVHMDLQAQNILFSRDSPSSVSTVISVLDWEDAAMADPRFELLLLGRKVCAHRDQAEAVWKHYAEQTKQDLGPLLPWLQLESIHSLLTISLQSMDMLNGGRNPWETSKDLLAKMEREMARWNSMLGETEPL